ncbi:MAG: serine/threonine-protein phosphatase [Verrucomicrobiae bacterium]|nr:serine/threonine-protein phosphatase [Verrucomicrobiae bacterium]
MALILIVFLICLFLTLIFFALRKPQSKISTTTQPSTPSLPSPFSQSDINKALTFQKHLLPKTPPTFAQLELASTYQPAQYLSGDFYDFFSFSDHCLGILIADVAGKGLPAALVMTLALTHFRHLAPTHSSPSALLKEMNRRLNADCCDNLFITACYAIVDIKNNSLTIARAGHEIPLHYNSTQATLTPIESPGMALGIDKGERFDRLIQDSVITLQSGDSVTFFTDGVNETQNNNEEEFGMERLKQSIETIEKNGPKTGHAQFLLENIIKKIKHYRDSALPTDDLTLITLYVT